MSQKTKKTLRQKIIYYPQSIYRQWHAIAGLVASVFLVSLSITGIYLNHQSDWFKPTSKSSITSEGIKEVVLKPGDNHHLYVLTEHSLYETTSQFKVIKKIKTRYPSRHIADIEVTPTKIWLALENGLLLVSQHKNYKWDRIAVPDLNQVKKLSLSKNNHHIIVEGKKGIKISHSGGESWLPLYETTSTLTQVMRSIHSGWIAAPWLVYAHDLSALILIFLVVTGLIIFYRKFKVKTKKEYKKL